MKKATLLGKFQLLVLILFLSSAVFAGNIIVNENGSNSFALKENTYSVIRLTNSIAEMDFMSVKTKAGNFTLFNIPEYGYTVVDGEPKLPVIKKLIEVPLDASFEISILTQEYEVMSLSELGITEWVMPAQPPLSKSIDNPDDVEFVFNQSSYQIDDFLGQELVQVVDMGMMRGVRIARLEIAPVQYNPVTNQIKVFTNVEIKVNFKGADIQMTMDSKKNLFSPYFEGIYSQLINYKSMDGKDLIMDEPPTFVIVSDAMFQAALQPFIAWKVKKGFNVIEAYTNDPGVGTTTTSIKNYLMNLYNNPPAGTNPPSFALLVGDVAQIPVFNTVLPNYNHITDLYYFEYTGDLFPEIYYGRFSATSLTQLQPQIDKTLEYEQYLFPDPTFLDEVVMVAGADSGHQTWSNGQINYGTTYYFNAAHGMYSHTYLQPEPGGGNYAQQIKQNINDGVSYANYTAHCSAMGWADPSFTISDIASLTNAHKYSLMVGNCCSSVEFQSTCFGEEIVRAANKGALGYIGGSNSTYWDEDYWWGVGSKTVVLNPVYDASKLGAYDRTFHDHGEPLAEWYVTQGQMIPAGNFAVSQSNSGMKTYYWEIYHLMGDPSVMIYYSQSPDAVANYQALMPLASTTFTVNTDPYAYVAISKDGVLHGCAIADNTGLAEVTMFNPITVPGTADVVITGQNLKPFMGTVTVASPEGAYVLMNEMEIDDSNGNNNGIADFDEYIMLDITLENLGSATATNVTATLSTTDEYITLNSYSHSWPNIPAGTTSMQPSAFAFTIDELIPDQHVANFEIEITDGTDTWSSSFNVTLNSPVLTIQSYIVDDTYGNNNGRLDPGENADIIIPNLNEGGSDALNTMATAAAIGTLITINNANYTVGNIAPGQTLEAVFNVTVSPDAQVGDVVNVNYAVASGVYTAYSALSLNIGLIIEDFESGGFTSYEWEFSGNANWLVNQQNPFEGEYSAKSGDIDDYETSALYITVDVSAADQISFYYMVSSEDNYDYLRFYIDSQMQDEWAGEVAWTEASYPVTVGTHTFKWEYSKDVSVSTGSDLAAVDYIIFPPFAGVSPLGVFASANPQTICEGESSQLNAFAMGGSGTYSYEWIPTTGLNDPNIANPVATPEETTTYTVTVNDGDATVMDDVTVTVNPTPETATVTQQGNLLISSATTGNQWHNNSGLIPGATGQSYEPLATDDYYVIVTNGFGCESEQSNVYHFVYTGIIDISEGKYFSIYPNPFKESVTLDYTVKSVTDVKITIFDTYGQLITTLQNQTATQAGNHRITFDASYLLPGIYFCKIETSDYSVVQRIVHSR
jgi:hypothetical protein